jgi:hypothetical protein
MNSVQSLCVLAGAVSRETYPGVQNEITGLRIRTEYWAKPIPSRKFGWSAVDENTYDGADDSRTRGQIGYGATEAEAVADLKMILEDASA